MKNRVSANKTAAQAQATKDSGSVDIRSILGGTATPNVTVLISRLFLFVKRFKV